jgi:hypothetical protein
MIQQLGRHLPLFPPSSAGFEEVATQERSPLKSTCHLDPRPVCIQSHALCGQNHLVDGTHARKQSRTHASATRTCSMHARVHETTHTQFPRLLTPVPLLMLAPQSIQGPPPRPTRPRQAVKVLQQAPYAHTTPGVGVAWGRGGRGKGRTRQRQERAWVLPSISRGGHVGDSEAAVLPGCPKAGRAKESLS